MQSSHVLEALAVNAVALALLFATGKATRILTQAGLLHAFILGTTLWSTLGWQAWSTAMLFLISGSVVTKVKMADKLAQGIAEKRHGARGPENVWGSAAAGTACALAAVAYPQHAPLLKIGFTASFAAKLCDTAATELGKAYGRRAYLVTTLRRVRPGTVGAVSLEGTAAGAAGAALITLYAVATALVPRGAALPCLAAAVAAAHAESVLNATLQGRARWLTGEVINAVLTVLGAALGVALWLLQQRRS
ncbi:integral membrane protein DUF92-domain-containing protein [Tribonema minus]|uniref:Integral membrane protein DUF92-domain-containing protein n=1 Tax=Tribonema minus TaxID=303371 RepID=A0A835ZCA4_9STRA|nr:integral membrane protein DUF92-domain-containing protein [Tribonema minus]